MQKSVWVLAGIIAAAVTVAAQVAVESLAKGDASGIQTARQVVVRSDGEWQALWKMHAPDQNAPGVDFNSKMVVGVFAGSKPSAGYAIEIVGARMQGMDLVVEYVERRPGRGQMQAQILIEPFHLVTVPKHSGPVRFLNVPG
jgi:hypothetical protein